MGDETGTLLLYDRADQDGSSHASAYRKNITNYHMQQPVEHTVEIQTLDQWAASASINSIDFLKIDTEGYEFEVLKGAKELLEAGRINVIQFEFGTTHCFSRRFIHDFIELLPDHILFRLFPRGLLRLDLPTLETEIFAFQNIVAIPANNAPT